MILITNARRVDQTRCMKSPAVYILASRRNGTLYVGVTSDLPARIWQHKNDVVPGFTHRYCVHCLVWFELHPGMESAISREKAIKAWKRDWKLRLIESVNPDWQDRYAEIIRSAGSQLALG